jgi:ABC-type nitrate/sulfonate/bicarbonate transport system substrate-binding protein
MISKGYPAGPAFILALIFFTATNAFPGTISDRPIRTGYFEGRLTALLMRAYENKEFDAAGLPVELYTSKLRGKELTLVPKSIAEFYQGSGGEFYAGIIRGTELTDAIMRGTVDLATAGESSFIESMYAGKPIVAIAELGHHEEECGRMVMIRKGIEIKSPRDLLGKILVSRRAGPADAAILKLFLDRSGVDLQKDILQLNASSIPRSLKEKQKLPKDKVIVIDDVYEDDIEKGIANKVIDGGYLHARGISKGKEFYYLQPLHALIKPALSHVLLVCRKDYLDKNRDKLVKLIEVYMNRIKYEQTPDYIRKSEIPDKKKGKLAYRSVGYHYPEYAVVRIELLYDMQKLLAKYGTLGYKKIAIEDFVDNSLVMEAAKNLGVKENDD